MCANVVTHRNLETGREREVFPGLKIGHKILTVLKSKTQHHFCSVNHFCGSIETTHSLVNPKTIHRLEKYVHSVCKKDLFYSISENGLQKRVER